jgi:hypothetical protein
MTKILIVKYSENFAEKERISEAFDIVVMN